MNDVAAIHHAEAHAPGDWRGDGRIAELHLRVVDGALVGIDLRLLLLDERGLGVDLLLRDGERADGAVALEVALGVCEQRLVERLLGDRLVEDRLKWPRIDLQEEIALLDHLAFLEGDLVDLAVDARADGHRVPALHDAQAIEVDGKVLLLSRGDVNGNRGFVRFCRRILLPGTARGVPVQAPHAHTGDDEDHEQPLQHAQRGRAPGRGYLGVGARGLRHRAIRHDLLGEQPSAWLPAPYCASG